MLAGIPVVLHHADLRRDHYLLSHHLLIEQQPVAASIRYKAHIDAAFSDGHAEVRLRLRQAQSELYTDDCFTFAHTGDHPALLIFILCEGDHITRIVWMFLIIKRQTADRALHIRIFEIQCELFVHVMLFPGEQSHVLQHTVVVIVLPFKNIVPGGFLLSAFIRPESPDRYHCLPVALPCEGEGIGGTDAAVRNHALCGLDSQCIPIVNPLIADVCRIDHFVVILSRYVSAHFKLLVFYTAAHIQSAVQFLRPDRVSIIRFFIHGSFFRSLFRVGLVGHDLIFCRAAGKICAIILRHTVGLLLSFCRCRVIRCRLLLFIGQTALV